MKYYFISYMYGAGDQRFQNMLTTEHPLEWQVRVRKSYNVQYKLVHWQEITEEEYDTYKDHIG